VARTGLWTRHYTVHVRSKSTPDGIFPSPNRRLTIQFQALGNLPCRLRPIRTAKKCKNTQATDLQQLAPIVKLIVWPTKLGIPKATHHPPENYQGSSQRAALGTIRGVHPSCERTTSWRTPALIHPEQRAGKVLEDQSVQPGDNWPRLSASVHRTRRPWYVWCRL